MADRLWYAALNGKQAGPFSEMQMLDMIARGEVNGDTLVWTNSMADWARAGDAPGLMPPGPPPMAPPPPPPPRRASVPQTIPVTSDWPGGEPGNPLVFIGGTWPLFGRSLLVWLGQLLVIPSPWTNTSFYRWMTRNIRLPDGRFVRFEGKPGDIWYIFIALALVGLGGLIHGVLTILLIPLTAYLYLRILRWFFSNLAWEGRTVPLSFKGQYLPLLGWWALYWVSLISIIGWAWVFTAMTRWICRNVEGSSKRLTFVAGGWSVLWRLIVFALSAVLIIPIPWTMRWLARWSVSQFALSERV